jgi:hypothetical protein
MRLKYQTKIAVQGIRPVTLETSKSCLSDQSPPPADVPVAWVGTHYRAAFFTIHSSLFPIHFTAPHPD